VTESKEPRPSSRSPTGTHPRAGQARRASAQDAQLDEAKRDLRTTRAVLRSHFATRGSSNERAMRGLRSIDRIKDTDVPF